MSRYQITDLATMTGIKAHTIRIWEKRYRVIEPRRTPTNIRYYDDDQVRRLLNISLLNSMGHKISRLAALNDEQLTGLVRELSTDHIPDRANAALITELISAMIAFDEAAFESLIDRAVERYGVFNAFSEVIYPFLVKTGVLWSVNELIPAQEHFASAIIRRKLICAAEALPAPTREASFLLFLPEQEWHEIGLLFAHYMLRSNGYKSTYLGQNVPFSNLLETCTRRKPTHLLSFYNQTKKKINLPERYGWLAGELPSTKVIVCGRPELLTTLPLQPNIQVCENAEALNTMIRSLA